MSTLFVFDQQTIHRKTLRRISGVLKLQRIILESKCAISEREIILKIEKNKRRAERANQKHVNNLTFGATVCFKCLVAKYIMSGTPLEHVFLSRVHA